MRRSPVDYELYNIRCESIDKCVGDFMRGDFLVVGQFTLGGREDFVYGDHYEHREPFLRVQLEGIAKTLAAYNDWVPYLEPWLGVGVYAEAFGCPFHTSPGGAPWTEKIIHCADDMKRLEKPDINRAEMLQKVLELTLYFNEQTQGEIAISATDTQSALGTLACMSDMTWMLSYAWDYPEEFHRVLGLITDLIIEFTLLQRTYCDKPAMPGHTMWSPPSFTGISVSDDMLNVVGAGFYEEFGMPYDQKLADALGGIGVHSCGPWPHNFKSAQKLNNFIMADLAVSKHFDPIPNDIGKVVAGFQGTGAAVQIRCDPDPDLLAPLLASDVRAILSLFWDEDPAQRDKSYREIKNKWESYRGG